ncbi:YggT family protein [bacterium]|nr:YggT family protein [bacterium]
MVTLTILGQIIRIVYYLALIYYLLIVIFFIMSWFSALYSTKVYDVFRRITSPFMNIFSRKLIVGGLDLGSTLGLILYALILYGIEYLSIIL